MFTLTRLIVAVLFRRLNALEVLDDLDESFAVDLASGMPARRARRRFRTNARQSLTQIWIDRRRRTHPPVRRRRDAIVGDLRQDVRLALRTLRRRPLFAATAVLTLALGIGANSAIFSVVHGVLFRPLAVLHGEQLVSIWTYDPRDPTDANNSSGPNIRDWQARATSFDGLFAWNRDEVLYANHEGLTDRLRVVRMTRTGLDVLGVPPALGRPFGPGDEQPGAARVVVIGDGFWHRQFGGDPAALGATLSLDGVPHQVVGIMPAGFGFPYAEDADAFLPFDQEIADTGRDMVWLGAIARLRPGTTIATAQADMDALHGAIRTEHPDETVNTAIRVVSVQRDLVGDVRPALLLLLGATGFLLLMACANVANLLLARASGRSTEVALRQSLGASRGRIVRQLLTESAVLAACASIAGLALAVAGRDLLMALAPAGLPGADHVVINGSVLAFTAAVGLLTAFGFGLVPALVVSGGAPSAALTDAGRGSVGHRQGRAMRSTLVVVQVSVATMLAVGAGLLLQSFGRLAGVDAGFDGRNVVVADITLPPDRYATPESRRVFYEEAVRRVGALPGAGATGITLFRPLSDSRINYEIRVEGTPRPAAGKAPLADIGIVTTGYLEAFDIHLREGRLFTPADTRSAERVAVINAAMAHLVFGEASPIDRRVALVTGSWDDEPNWRRIVGVIDDIRQYSLARSAEPTIYLDVFQQPQFQGEIAVRVDGQPAAFAGGLRRTLVDLEPGLPLPTVRTMDSVRRESLAAPRFYAVLLATFAGLALVLASIGIYGVLSYSVSDRTREIGVRMAFGASRPRILGQLLGEGVSVAGLGVVLGLGGSLAVGRLMSGLVFDVDPTNPLRLAGIGALLLGVAAVACYVPAARAARLDAAEALRGDGC